jgi:RNA polymerase sigma-70 factor, ECF subfamily
LSIQTKLPTNKSKVVSNKLNQGEMQDVNTYFQIIKRCKQQNNSAQRLLYNRYAPVMQGVCFRYISDAKVVKNILQKGFIKVFSEIKLYEGNDSLECWIKSIFITLILEHLLKHHQIRKEKLVAVEEFHSNEYHKNKPVYDDLSETELLIFLDRLPVNYRITFNLFCIEHYNHEKIAKMLGIDITTSKSYLRLSIDFMQNELYKISLGTLSA